MSQHDMDLANAAGASFRADLNLALAALVGNSSGATAPATTFAYMFWADTTSGWIKMRNGANSAWIKVRPLGTGAAVDIASAATLDLTANSASSGTIRVTGTTATTAITLEDGQTRLLRAAAAWPITHGASLICPGSTSYTCAAGDLVLAIGEAAGVVRLMIWKGDGTAVVVAAQTSSSPPVRQTVLSGPVDSSGFAAFGGSTGSTTVTASGTLKATAAAGGDENYTGSIVNPSWTGLSTNGTMYLYLDITSGGVVTTGSTTLAPTYQWGGTYSTTNLQNTFNIQEMTMKVGNGSTAAQVYRVFVGEVTVAGGVVTVITWYALMGRYLSAWTATLPANNTTTSANHNLGVIPLVRKVEFLATASDASIGDYSGSVIDLSCRGSPYPHQFMCPVTSKTISFQTGSGGVGGVIKSSGDVATIASTANFSYRFLAQRGW